MGGPARQRQLEGVVLHLRDFGDAHRIVEVLTPDEGRVSLLARGARASRRRFAGALDLFVSLRLQCTTKGELWSLEAADVISLRLGLRADLEALHRASLLCECVRLTAPEHHAGPSLYSAVAAGLDRLERGEPAGSISALVAVLDAAGILPDLGRCARCGAPAPGRGTLEPSDGLRCDTCAGSRVSFPLGALRGDPGTLGTPLALATVEDALAAWVETHVGRALRTHAALVAIRHAEL